MLSSNAFSYLTAALALVGSASAAVLPRQAQQVRQGFKSVGYYGNWGAWGSFPPQNIQAGGLTHLLYSFAQVTPSNGTVFLSNNIIDAWWPYPGDEKSDPNQDLRGALKQIFLLKKQNRNMKTMLSIGGWGAAEAISAAISTVSGRSEFAWSAVQLVLNYGFDGVEVDFEYPATQADTDNLTDLIARIRNVFNFITAVTSGSPKFYIALAVPIGYNRDKFDLPKLNQYVDFFNAMAYDYTGPWATASGHQANLYQSKSNPASTPADTSSLIDIWIGKDGVSGLVDRKKVLLGMPAYGRVFKNTDGAGKSFDKTATDGVTVLYKDIPQDSSVQNDNEAIGASRYNAATREWTSFDNVWSVERKVDFIASKWLGGAFIWDLSGDYPLSSPFSIINKIKTRYSQVFGPNMEYVPNNLYYPNSKFRNIRENTV